MADFVLSGKITIPTTAYSSQIALGDFSGDGRADLLVTEFDNISTGTFPVHALTSNGNGTFTEITSSIIGGSTRNNFPRQILVADFNNDGKADFFISDHGTDTDPFPGGQSALLLSNSNKTLTNSTISLPQQLGYAHSSAFADVNSDGRIDILEGNAFLGSSKTPPMVLINNGSTFTAKVGALPASVTGQSGYTYTFVDVKNDRIQDLYAITNTLGPAHILYGDGKGVFTESGLVLPVYPGNISPIDSERIDINGDGRDDLLVSGYISLVYKGVYTQALIQQADGSFKDETSSVVPGNDLTSAAWRERIIPVDLNSDGQMDAVVQYDQLSRRAPEIWINNHGTFKATAVNQRNTSFNRIATGDVDGNGTPDIVLSSYDPSVDRHTTTIQTLLNTGASKIGVAIADQLSVVYLGRGISASWRDATANAVERGASDGILKAFYDTAVADKSFSAKDSLQNIVNKTFLNIFGVNASVFEQNAWANTVTVGAVSKEALPWAMFNSYLGANNVPDSYKIPAQSRIIAAHAFTNAIVGAAEQSLGAPGVSSADAARSWLLPIRSQADAAGKVSSADAAVASISAAPRLSGPIEAEIRDGSPMFIAAGLIDLVGVPPEAM